MIGYKEGCCKDFYRDGTCKYGSRCKYAHISNHVEVPITCKYCCREGIEMYFTDCGHLFCLDCAVNEFKRSGKCTECGEVTDGRFYSV
ncbi:hypothetical protein PAEPH01_2207 [Pancytospora epiphaga]|nr:hypothetical protein PAEPH01_2207 [Pancytospora epiphaga]